MKSKETREQWTGDKCDRCNFSVLDTNQFLHVEWCKDHRMYEKLCIKCIKET